MVVLAVGAYYQKPAILQNPLTAAFLFDNRPGGSRTFFLGQACGLG